MKTRRHANGDGSLELLPNGIYLARWMGINTHTGKYGRCSKSTGTRDKTQAEKLLRQFTLANRAKTAEDRYNILAAQAKGRVSEIEAEKRHNADFPIKDLSDRFFKSVDGSNDSLSDNTKTLYTYAINHFVNFSSLHYHDTIQKVDNDLVIRYLQYLQDDKPVRTYNLYLQVLRRVFDVVKNEAYLTHNWFKDHPYKSVETQVKRNFTPEEIEKIKEGLKTKKSDYRLYWYLGLYTGMRHSDCKMLKFGSVDLDKNLLTVMPIKTRKYKTIVHIPIHPDLKSVLMEVIEGRNLKDNDFVMQNFYKKDDSDIRYLNRNFLKDIGIETKNDAGKVIVGFHSCRSTFAQSMLKVTSINTVMSMLGHTSAKMTIHYTRENIDDNIEAMSMFGYKINDDNDKTVVQDDIKTVDDIDLPDDVIAALKSVSQDPVEAIRKLIKKGKQFDIMKMQMLSDVD